MSRKIRNQEGSEYFFTALHRFQHILYVVTVGQYFFFLKREVIKKAQQEKMLSMIRKYYTSTESYCLGAFVSFKTIKVQR